MCELNPLSIDCSTIPSAEIFSQDDVLVTELATVKEQLISAKEGLQSVSSELRRKVEDCNNLEVENADLVKQLMSFEAENAELKEELEQLTDVDYTKILKRKVRPSNNPLRRNFIKT